MRQSKARQAAYVVSVTFQCFWELGILATPILQMKKPRLRGDMQKVGGGAASGELSVPTGSRPALARSSGRRQSRPDSS